MLSATLEKLENVFEKEQVYILLRLVEEQVEKQNLATKQDLELETAKIYEGIAISRKEVDLKISGVEAKIAETNKEIALVRNEVDVKTSEIKREIETKIAETNKEIAISRKETDVKISGVETKIVEAKNSTIIWVIGSLGLLQTIFKALDYFLK